jgi:carbohydrate kinase (thermoresistant glucokinase family)
MPGSSDPLPPLSLVVMGVSGVGKTSVAHALVARTGWTFQEGDDLHPAANRAKMAAGHPLVDDDRWPWLRRIAEWIGTQEAAGEGAVVTCSALKRSYRDLLLGGRPEARMIFLSVDRDEVSRRLAIRHGHFFPAQLADGQFAALEPPQPDERAVTVLPAGDLEEMATAIIKLIPAEAMEGGHEAHA